ncbi:MAG TPA: S-methyl-5-thioribose-1-phosphate isomerase [Gemmatimonadaceae bacterium]|nr:S-methyl-5-thioribose-1-phosphate isomerase [Gemmatimonadaceae bacterium]
MDIIQSVRWTEDGRGVRIIDQRLLPGKLVERDLRRLAEVCDAIRTLAVRGAPAIGIAGAMGLVAVLGPNELKSRDELLAEGRRVAAEIASTRPTAVNLAWALDRVLKAAAASRGTGAAMIDAMRREANAILEEDRAMCRSIGEHGLALLHDGARVLTHCNAGALATGGIGTALAPIYLAKERGWTVEIFVDESRPLLQGSRLTAWELQRAGVPVTVLTDGMAASLMREHGVDLCIVGADRIAANGDVANKIGTYGLAIAARYHEVPFVVAAPTSTMDPATASGNEIVIEQREADEVRRIGDVPTAPPDVSAYNPAFDVTPAALVSAIVTDRGIHRPPFAFAESLGELAAGVSR